MPSTLDLTATEFRNLVNSGDLEEINELLLDHPHLRPQYLHYCSLSRSLRQLEENLLATQLDLDHVFEDMTRNDFDDAFAFFVARRRRE